MTQKTFNRVLELSERKIGLQEVLYEIDKEPETTIFFARKSGVLCNYTIMQTIKDKLDFHAIQIRREIIKEIEDIDKEIEEL